MLSKVFECASFVLAAALASGQPAAPQTKVFSLANGATPQQLQEIRLAVKVAGGIPQTEADASKNAISVSGTAGQIELAQWLIGELDQPAGTTLPANSAEHRYKIPGEPDEVVSVFYLAHAVSGRDLQEMQTLIHSMGDIRNMFPYASQRALAMRGTAAQMELAKWLVNELDKPAGDSALASQAPHEYLVQGSAERVGVFFIQTSQELQGVMDAVRTASSLHRMFYRSAPKAVVVRGTPEQIEIAGRVIQGARQ